MNEPNETPVPENAALGSPPDNAAPAADELHSDPPVSEDRSSPDETDLPDGPPDISRHDAVQTADPPPSGVSPSGLAAAFSDSEKTHGNPAALVTFFSLLLLLTAVTLFSLVYQTQNTYLFGINARYTPERGNDYLSQNHVFDALKSDVTVTLSFEGGAPKTVVTKPVTAGELIASHYPDLGRDGSIHEYSVAADTVLTDGMELSVDLVTYVDRKSVEVAHYETEEIGIQTVPKGTRTVIREGSDGSAEVEIREKYVNGELADAFLLSTTYLVEPVNEQVEVGTGGTIVSKRGVSYEYSYYIDCICTAYGVDTGYGGDGELTASMTKARYGVIAVDPEVIPLGSTVFITDDGDWGELGVRYAEDTGSAIKGNRVDVYMGDDLRSQRLFGRREMRVYILDEPEDSE